MFDFNIEKLSKGLEFLAIDYDHNMIHKFISYFEFLNKENNKYNLTNITDFDDFISLHVLDSLSLILPIQKYNINHQNILDIGSGNGFPGIPFQICISHSNMILVDSVKKKTDFMQKLIKLLNLNEIEIVNDRIEDLGKDKYFRKTQNLILARAVAKISTLIEVSLPLLEIGGYCIFHKSNLSQSEFESMNKTLRYFDAQLIEIYKVSNELIARNHNLIIIKKNSEIDFEYPRNNNKPFRKPLF